MKDVKEELKENLNRLFGVYLPNKVDLENLTNYLYKVMVYSLKNTNIKEEAKKITGITELDKQGFEKALHSIAIYSARDVMFKTLKSTFNQLKNQVDLVSTSSEPNFHYSDRMVSYGNRRNSSEADFTLDDIGDMAVAPSSAKIELSKKVVEESDSIKIPNRIHNLTGIDSDLEFDISDESLSKFNMGGVPKKEDEVDDNYRSNASDYSSSVYSSVPYTDSGLDY